MSTSERGAMSGAESESLNGWKNLLHIQQKFDIGTED